MEVESTLVPQDTNQDSLNTIKTNNNPQNISLEERQCLHEFRKAVEAIENLYCPLDDEFLLRFLRAKNYNVKKAVKMVEVFYELKLQNDHSLATTSTETVERILLKGGLLVLKNRDSKGRQILYFRASIYEPYEFTEDEMVAAAAVILEEMTSYEETQKNGCCFIVDYTDFTFAQARAIIARFTIKKAKMAIKVFQGGYPVKMKGCFAINFPYVMQGLYAITKPLLKEKLRRRTHVTRSGYATLHKYIDPSILPVSLGGTLSLEEATDPDIIPNLYKKENHYKDLLKYGYKN